MPGPSRSGLVRLFKVALPLAAVGLLAALFLAGRPEIGGVVLSDLDFDAEDGLRLLNPEVSGETEAGEPFSATAEWARPDGPDPERVALGGVRGEVALQDGRRLTLAAGGGELRPRAETMRLEDGVVIQTSDGYRLRAAAADVDIAARQVAAVGPVEGRGPAGAIFAGSMRVERRDDETAAGDYIWFEDRVRVVIDPTAER